MNIAKHLVAGFVLASAFIASASAAVIQTGTGNGNFDGYQAWGLHDLSSVTFAKNTNVVTGLSTSAVAYDQGWGGEWADGNHVVATLYQGSNLLWSTHVAGAGRFTYHVQNWTIDGKTAVLDSLNSALAAIIWDDISAVTMRLQANPIGWGGWELHVRDAGFTVTSDATDVPEPASLALLGLGLAGLLGARRKQSA